MSNDALIEMGIRKLGLLREDGMNAPTIYGNLVYSRGIPLQVPRNNECAQQAHSSRTRILANAAIARFREGVGSIGNQPQSDNTKQ